MGAEYFQTCGGLGHNCVPQVWRSSRLHCRQAAVWMEKVAMWNRVDWYSTVFLTRLCKTRSDSVRDVWGSNTNIRHVSFEGLCGYTGGKKIKIVLQGLFRLLEAHLFWPLPKKRLWAYPGLSVRQHPASTFTYSFDVAWENTHSAHSRFQLSTSTWCCLFDLYSSLGRGPTGWRKENWLVCQVGHP